MKKIVPRTPYHFLTHWLEIGGGERDRTDDLLRARQALSQLSYTPHFQNQVMLVRKPRFILPTSKLAMVGLDGVEPSTSRLSGVRSNQTELQAQSRFRSWIQLKSRLGYWPVQSSLSSFKRTNVQSLKTK